MNKQQLQLTIAKESEEKYGLKFNKNEKESIVVDCSRDELIMIQKVIESVINR